MADNVDEEEKTEEENSSIRKMSKTEFWTRLALWVVLALVVPIVYLAIAYGLFTCKSGTSMQLSGWGTVAVVFAGVMLIVVVMQARATLPRGTFARQCIDGALALIPLLCAILVIHAVKANMDGFEKFLIVTFVCEALAVPANPLPHWGLQNHIELSENFIVSAIKKGLGKK
jgi:uncharacterized protein YqhQ